MADLDKKDDVIEEKVIEESQSDEPQYTEEEQSAISKGWKPKDQWEGDEDEWKPAKVFNEIGRLKDENSRVAAELKKANKVTQLMKEHHINVRQQAYNDALKTLKAQRTAALEDGEIGKAEAIRDKIDDIRDQFRNNDVLPKEIEREVQAVTAEPDPELFAFMDRNPWYKPGTRDEMSRDADTLGAAYKLKNPEAPFKELIAYVEKSIRKQYPEKFQRPNNPVNEPGTTRGTSSRDTTRLTEEQRSIARGFGMTDAEYAKEMNSYKGR